MSRPRTPELCVRHQQPTVAVRFRFAGQLEAGVEHVGLFVRVGHRFRTA